jgi:hypothetical protein
MPRCITSKHTIWHPAVLPLNPRLCVFSIIESWQHRYAIIVRLLVEWTYYDCSSSQLSSRPIWLELYSSLSENRNTPSNLAILRSTTQYRWRYDMMLPFDSMCMGSGITRYLASPHQIIPMSWAALTHCLAALRCVNWGLPCSYK